MAIIDKYPGKNVAIVYAGRCCNCLQPVYRNTAYQLVHIESGESRCRLYALLKNEENL